MALKEYKRKRDFNATPEPGAKKPGRGGHGFVVQKHDASRMHYDLRLEVGGVLASWAVPKGPSLDPADKRLAVRVEDHPIGYADFEGVIPQGQYGGGTVMVWDRGTWSPDPDTPDAAGALRRGKLSFTLTGEKLHGSWTLARMHGRPADDGRNWLLIKHRDDWASEQGAIVDDRPESVKSGRSLAEIAGAGDALWDSGRGRKRTTNGRARAEPDALDPSGLTHARKAAMPRALGPQLCTLTDRAPPGDGWLHEIKFDGYRIIARRSKSGVRLVTRGDKDWAARFGPIALAVEGLAAETAILDGEATILDASGVTSFQRLQNAIRTRRFGGLVYFVFDLLYLDGYDLTRSPLLERKKLLRRIVPSAVEGVIRYSDHVPGGGEAVAESACALSLEGIISKRVDAPYTQGRSRSWLKIKCGRRQEFVVVGWSPPSGSRKHFGALLLGAFDAEGILHYVGKVGTGFSAATLKEIGGQLKRIERTTSPLDEAPGRAGTRGAHWVRPVLVAEVAFTEMTDDGRLRHPSFRGLRLDKEAAGVKIEEPEPLEEAARQNGRKKGSKGPRDMKRRKSKRGGAAGDAEVAGVRISSPGRVLYPDAQLTKLDLARYIESVADRLLPFVEGRPLSTVRCPQGRTSTCFFQKHLRETFGDPVRSIRVQESSGEADYIGVDSVGGLVTLVQFGVLEIHPWGATGRDIEHPDLLTIDLDPGEGVGLDPLKEGARRVREILESVDLACYLKATGGKGLHVVVPLRPAAGWDEAKAFCAAIAKRMEREDPGRYIAKASKAARKGKVFVDYLRNGRGATSIAPYSMRARPNAPVAMPLRWDELGRLTGPARYTVTNTPARLGRLKSDPWKGYHTTRQKLTASRASGIGSG